MSATEFERRAAVTSRAHTIAQLEARARDLSAEGLLGEVVDLTKAIEKGRTELSAVECVGLYVERSVFYDEAIRRLEVKR